jgi:hypothetical protein
MSPGRPVSGKNIHKSHKGEAEKTKTRNIKATFQR